MTDDDCSCDARLSRRGFLGLAAGVGAVAALDPFSVRAAFASGPVTGDVLVVVSLRGGFDGLSAVAPVADPAYWAARPTIGLPQGAALQLDPTFGMHPAMAPVMPWWRSGQLAVVHAVGQSDPTRSHFKAMEEMERAAPGSSVRTGWLDRMLGLNRSTGPLQAVAMGASPMPQSMQGPRPVMSAWDLASFKLGWIAASDHAHQDRWTATMNRLQTDAPADITSPARSALKAMKTIRRVEATGVTQAAYPTTKLGSALRDVARLIKADVGMQMATVDQGNWDMHAGLGGVEEGWMQTQLDELARSLAAFATDLGPKFANVTLLTLSEFGRRVHENGSGGLDHGHGNAMFLLGGGVAGGRVHGVWPGLPDSTGVSTDLAATTDYRSVLSEVLVRRCGVSRTATVFPGFTSSPLGVVHPR